jgi:hypothetical protein
MLVTARDSEEISRPHTLFARLIFVEISAFDNDYPHIARMGTAMETPAADCLNVACSPAT